MISVETLVTPEIAKEWLEHNIKNNRQVSQRVVDRYADDMKSGKWQLTADGISFNESGELTNGQHRLNAVIKANVPVKMYVTYGVPNESYIYDRGHMRGIANVLQMAGVNASHMDVGFVNLAVQLAKGDRTNRSCPDTMVRLILEHEGPTIREAENMVSVAGGGSKKRFTKNASCHFAAWCAIRNGICDKETVSNFFHVVNTGIYGEKSGEICAVYFRNFLLDNPGMMSRGPEGRERMFKLCLKAISDFTNGTNRKLPYRDSDYIKFDAFHGTTAESIIKNYINEDRNGQVSA